MRFWTADLHFQHTNVLTYCNRPFCSVNRMDEVLINNINMRATSNDTLVHLGDFMFYGKDHGVVCDRKKPVYYIDKIQPTVFFVKGNHDKNNKLNTVADMLYTHVGVYPVSASHYPSTIHTERRLPIHLCGHVHDKWKYFYDKEHKILNINVGIDVWNYQIVSDQELANFISKTKRELSL